MGRWRVVDIVTAAVLGVACGVIFMGWSASGGGPVLGALDAATPGLGGLMLGVWLLGGILGGLIIRKPGAALLVEVLAAFVEMTLGAKWGWNGVASGIAQGLGCELILLLWGYRRFHLVVAIAMGVVAAVFEWALELVTYANLAKSAVFNTIYLACMVISGVVAGVLGWFLVRALAKTGALDRFASGRTPDRTVA